MASEIVLRFYLAIGFVALSGLIALGVTSTDAAMKRMGKRWKQLHRLVYPIGVLALLHFFIQTKANVGEPVFVAGLFVWLMLWRLLPVAWRTALSTYFVLVPVSAVMTAAIEFAWYGLATKIDPFRILQANWSERFFRARRTKWPRSHLRSRLSWWPGGCGPAVHCGRPGGDSTGQGERAVTRAYALCAGSTIAIIPELVAEV